MKLFTYSITIKVLVCAPSNAAIDEILRRLTTDGVFGADGKTYIPMVVRLGPGVHHDLQKYSLEKMAYGIIASGL